MPRLFALLHKIRFQLGKLNEGMWAPVQPIREPRLILWGSVTGFRSQNQEVETGTFCIWHWCISHGSTEIFEASGCMYTGKFLAGNSYHLYEISSHIRVETRIDAGFSDSTVMGILQKVTRVLPGPSCQMRWGGGWGRRNPTHPENRHETASWLSPLHLKAISETNFCA